MYLPGTSLQIKYSGGKTVPILIPGQGLLWRFNAEKDNGMSEISSVKWQQLI
jgi:hypothetical protein